MHRAPAGGRLQVRRPGEGFDDAEAIGTTRFEWPLAAGWWSARPELAALAGKVHLRRGPLVYALDDRELPGVDLRRVWIDPTAPVDDADPRAIAVEAHIAAPAVASSPLYRSLDAEPEPGRRAAVVMRPYHAWPDGVGQLRIWLRRES